MPTLKRPPANKAAKKNPTGATLRNVRAATKRHNQLALVVSDARARAIYCVGEIESLKRTVRRLQAQVAALDSPADDPVE